MPTINDILTLAIQHQQARRFDQAATLYAVLLMHDPGQADALHLLGLVRQEQGRGETAVALMARGLRVNDSLASRHNDLGTALFNLGRLEPAAAALRQSLRRRPEQPAAWRMLGEARRRDGRGGAAAAYRCAVALQPELADAWYGLGAVIQGDETVLMATANATAATLFLRAARLRPDLLFAWVNLGIVLYVIGRLEEAEAALRRALAVLPDFDRALLRMGQTRLALGDVAGAANVLRWAGVRAPGDPEIALAQERAKTFQGLSRPPATAPAGLAIRGTFRNTSGYAFMVRQFVRQLHARGLPVQLMDVPVSFLKTMDDGQRDPFFDSFHGPVRSRALLNFVVPNLAEPVPGLSGALFTMSEMRRAPPDWVAYSLRQEHVIVPTPSSAEAWIGAGYPESRVRICPLGVDPRPLASLTTPMTVVDAQGRRLADYRTRVANISDLTSRKNLDGLLRVWLRATSPHDDAALVLKLGKGSPGEKPQIGAFLNSVAAAVGKSVADAAPVFIVSGAFSDDEMTALLASATHYWSMSHGEGWDLPMTQAGAMGLTLIAPRHSAYTAYLDDDVALMLPVRPTPGRPPYAGLEWWTPDEDAAAETLIRVVRDGLAPPASPRPRLTRDFSWERAGERLFAVLQDIGALPPALTAAE